MVLDRLSPRLSRPKRMVSEPTGYPSTNRSSPRKSNGTAPAVMQNIPSIVLSPPDNEGGSSQSLSLVSNRERGLSKSQVSQSP